MTKHIKLGNFKLFLLISFIVCNKPICMAVLEESLFGLFIILHFFSKLYLNILSDSLLTNISSIYLDFLSSIIERSNNDFRPTFLNFYLSSLLNYLLQEL